ncbi:MAG TPA: D-glycero-beta-D-manno-heptose 1,7-bisphosphate 7-phosphatase [Gammaproteobacteria bacterium]|nr:D-glycero-beta-D-manno-heptose 1,7-bisphosphate 7-phosphatase [Gammaproteobacteria bacterium]
MKNTWVLLDRDGVINFDSEDYIKSPEEWIPIPNSLEAIRLLNQKGYSVAIATNQSGIQRGLYSEQILEQIHQKMTDSLSKLGGAIAAIHYCPHGPNDGCMCRKPKPGLLMQIAHKFSLDLTKTPYVGDSWRDCQAAISAGCKPVLVKTGNGLITIKKYPNEIEHIPVFSDLYNFAYSLPFVKE